MNHHLKQWAPLLSSNFLSVFNDNLLKYSIIFVASSWKLSHGFTQSQVISCISAALILPYLFFSPIGGYLAARFSKRTIFMYGKILEIATLLIASAALFLHWFILSGISVFIMGTLSCLYSPSKYGLIRDIGGESEVSFGSGAFEMMSFLGILCGTVAAAYLSDTKQIWTIVVALIFTSLIGLISTYSIKAKESARELSIHTNLNPIKYLIDAYKVSRIHPNINKAVFGASAFWLLGSLLQMNMVLHVPRIYHLSNSKTSIILSIAAIGIAVGTYSAGKISGKEVRSGLIIAGLLGMTLCLCFILFLPLTITGFEIIVFCFAVFGGIFQIPCLAIIQQAPLGRRLGNIIGYLNMVTFIFVLVGAAFFSWLTAITNENSYVVFGAMLVVTTGVLLYYLAVNADFRKDFYRLVGRR